MDLTRPEDMELQIVEDGPAPACADCQDTGWRRVAMDPRRYPRGYAVERCACVERAYRAAVRSSVEVPEHFKDARLSLYLPQSPAAAAAKEACVRFVRAWPAVPTGLLLMGSAGCGKTHLAVATMLAVAERGGDAYFCNYARLLRELRDACRDDAPQQGSAIVRRIMGAQLVVIDELGAERATDWTRESLEVLFGELYDYNRPVIVTTNYTDDEPENPFANLEVRVGARVRSRLREMCEAHVFGGRDFRVQLETLDRQRKGLPAAPAKSTPRRKGPNGP